MPIVGGKYLIYAIFMYIIYSIPFIYKTSVDKTEFEMINLNILYFLFE